MNELQSNFYRKRSGGGGYLAQLELASVYSQADKVVDIQSISKMSATTTIVAGCLLFSLVRGGFHGDAGSHGYGFGYIGVGSTNAALKNIAKAAYTDMFISIVNKPVS